MPSLDMKVCERCRDLMSDEQTCEGGILTPSAEICPFCNKPGQLYTMRPMYVVNLFKKYLQLLKEHYDPAS